MKFIVSSTSLLKHLQTVGGVLNSSNTLPILDHFLFETKGTELTISASDLETTIITNLKTDKGDEDGKIAIPAKLLIDTLKTFPNQPLTFSCDPKSYAIEIVSENGKYKLSGQNGNEFPKLPEMEGITSLEIKSDVLFESINKTLFATGNDELRPVMSGVYFEFGEDNLTFVATDAHKLVRYKRMDVKSVISASFIMPKKPLNLLKSLLLTTDTLVTINYNKSNASFTFDSTTVICRLIDGKYPNYEAVIPKENPNKMVIDRIGLLNSIKRIAIFSNKSTHQVRFKITGNQLQLSAEDIDFQNEATERIKCEYEGEDMEIGFNSRFLQEMLSNLDMEMVNLELSASNRAGIFIPANQDTMQEDLLMLVMPVMLNS